MNIKFYITKIKLCKKKRKIKIIFIKEFHFIFIQFNVFRKVQIRNDK